MFCVGIHFVILCFGICFVFILLVFVLLSHPLLLKTCFGIHFVFLFPLFLFSCTPFLWFDTFDNTNTLLINKHPFFDLTPFFDKTLLIINKHPFDWDFPFDYDFLLLILPNLFSVIKSPFFYFWCECETKWSIHSTIHFS